MTEYSTNIMTFKMNINMFLVGDSEWTTTRTIDIPAHLSSRFLREKADVVERREEKRNAHKYCELRIVTETNARRFASQGKHFTKARSRYDPVDNEGYLQDLYDLDDCITVKVLRTASLCDVLAEISDAAGSVSIIFHDII